jgi:hypothetical protein
VLELVSTPEGILLESRRPARVVEGEDGVPLVMLDDGRTVTNDEAIEALHRQRDGA